MSNNLNSYQCFKDDVAKLSMFLLRTLLTTVITILITASVVAYVYFRKELIGAPIKEHIEIVVALTFIAIFSTPWLYTKWMGKAGYEEKHKHAYPGIKDDIIVMSMIVLGLGMLAMFRLT